MTNTSKKEPIGYVHVILGQVDSHSRRISRLQDSVQRLQNDELAPAHLLRQAWRGMAAVTLAFGVASGYLVYKENQSPTWQQKVGERIAADQACREQVRLTGGAATPDTLAPCMGLHHTYFLQEVSDQKFRRQATYSLIGAMFLSCAAWGAVSSRKMDKECKSAQAKIDKMEHSIRESQINRDIWKQMMTARPK